MNKIAIFTTLANFNPDYSLVTVIVNQARLLKEYSNKEVNILVLEGCKDNYPEDLKDNIKKIVPKFHWKDGVIDHTMIPKIQNMFQSEINNGTKYFICHDTILVRSYITYNEAIRRITAINNVKFFFWMHSGPHNRPAILNNRVEFLEHTLPANSNLVYLNYFDLQRACNMYDGVTTSKAHVVYNPVVEISSENQSKESSEIANKINFNEALVRCVYPFSTTRMQDKKVHVVLEILDIIKKKGYDVKFIACNAHANQQKEKREVNSIINKYTSIDYSLTKDDILFTSQYKEPKYEHGVPHEIVLDLFKMSNLFIFPSISEVCPLILQEAALTQNLIVANADFPSMMEMIGPDGGLFFRFGSILHNTSYGLNNTENDRKNYLTWVVENILPALQKNMYITEAMYNVSTRYGFKYIWNKQFKKLFKED